MKVDDKTRKLFDALAMFLQDSLNELKKLKKGDKIKVSLGAIAVLQDSFTIDLVTTKKELRNLAVATKDLFKEVVERLTEIEEIGGSHVLISISRIHDLGEEFDKVIKTLHKEDFKKESKSTSWWN
jgi:hypothetical protein